MELRAARAAARRRVGAYTAIVTAVGFAWLALAGGTPALGQVRGVELRAWVSAMLLGMAPVVAVVAQTSLGLVPILVLPTVAVYLACRGAIRADRERARARAAAERARRPRPSRPAWSRASRP